MAYKTVKKPSELSEPQRKRRGGPSKGSQNARKHGHYVRRAELMLVGFDGIDKRTTAGREYAQKREQVFLDLGGRETVSQIKLDLVEKYMRTVVLIDSLDNWLFQQPTLINKRKRSLLPIVEQRSRLVDSALRLAQAIGLERRKVQVDIVGELAALAKENTTNGAGNE